MKAAVTVLLAGWPLLARSAEGNFSTYVNLFIGTEGERPGTSYNGGNVFPGASLPFGAAKVGIDTTIFIQSTNANGGYTPDGNVTAITMLHESGTGGAPTYGLIPQMPLTTIEGVNLLDNLTYMQPRIGHDEASVGYYKTQLQNGVTVELGATMHAGLMHYTFPAEGGRYILVDLSHYLPAQGGVAGQWYSNAHIDLSDDGSKYSGYGVYRGGWSKAPDHPVYFCAEFDSSPKSSRIFYGPYTDPYWVNTTSARHSFSDQRSLSGGTASWQFSDRIGALFEFSPDTSAVRSRVGVSWVSVDAACQFVDEVEDYDLNKTQAAAVQQWEDTVFSTIQIGDSSNATLVEMLYSAMYHAHLLPSNRTGDNPYWETDEPVFDDYYTFWDTFRCLNSMYLLLNPDLAEAIVRNLIDIWRHERFMPDGRSANFNGRVQGGSNADNVLADAYVKGIRGGINWTEGYLAMKTDAETVPYFNQDPNDLTGSTKEGRGALPDWLKYGYVTPKYGRSISKTVEYSLNDFSLYQVAQGEMAGDAATYLNRSAGWQRIWAANASSFNYTGFLAPKYGNGTLMPYDPADCGECEWQAIAYEALPWEYSWSIPFDMTTLIRLMGGDARAESRLDTMFIPGLKNTEVGPGGNNGIGDTLFNPGNEPSFSTPFLYHYFKSNGTAGNGRQFKSVQRSHEIVNQYYSTTASGLPGNSDAGALDSWLIWNLIGLYPVVTQPLYLILAPWFSDLTISVGNGKTMHIMAENLDLPGGSYYVQNLTVNGQAWEKNWIEHDVLVQGGEMKFVLGTQQKAWDTGDVPPSPGHFTI